MGMICKFNLLVLIFVCEVYSNSDFSRFMNQVCDGKISAVEKYIVDMNDINAGDGNNDTPLLIAARKGYIDIVKLLIKNGAKINIQDDYGDTALHAATFNGHKDIVKFLLSKGADTRIKNYFARTPVFYSTNNEITKILNKAYNR